MRNPLESRLPDADMQEAPRALLRAARRAREIARQTGTGVVVLRDGKIVEESPDDDADDPAAGAEGEFDAEGDQRDTVSGWSWPRIF